jgi:dipeptidyl aminopeptidase/acylaminoacyl peptidase
MFDVPSRRVQRILAVPESVKLRYLVWNDNETLLVVLSATTESKSSDEVSLEAFRTIAQDVSGGDGRMLPMQAANSHEVNPKIAPLAYLIAARTSSPHSVIMMTPDACRCLLAVDTRTGKDSIIRHGNEFTTAWVVDRTGRAVAREDWDWHHHAYRVLALGANEVDKPREILRKDDSEHPRLAGLLADGSALVLLAANGRSHQAAWALPLDGSALNLIAEDPNADITRVYTDPYSGAIIGVYLGGSIASVHWLDAVAQRRQDVLDRSFGGRQVHVYGWTEDGTKTLASVETPSSPPVYYLVDFATHRADIAAEEYPALAGVPLGEVKEISYWLTQFIASRGFAVLQPQFRGSIGFGDAFREAGYRQWGGLMQDDVTDGVRAMIEQGIADPQRICIVGASYGGYAALAGAAFTPDLYSCAVSIRGVTDLPALMRETVPIYGGALSTSLSDWKAHIGAPNDGNLSAKSPINSVKSIKIPILIIYGTGDGVVPNEQSERMARALKAAGKTVDVAILKGEDHWLSRTETRIQVLKELDAFLGKHL